MQESEPPPEEAVGGEGDHAEGVAVFELEYAGDELGDASVGEGERDDDGDGFVREEAGVDRREDAGGEAEAGEAEWAGVGEGLSESSAMGGFLSGAEEILGAAHRTGRVMGNDR